MSVILKLLIKITVKEHEAIQKQICVKACISLIVPLRRAACAAPIACPFSLDLLISCTRSLLLQLSAYVGIGIGIEL